MTVESPDMNATLQNQARLQEIADLGLLSGDVDAVLQELCTSAATEFGLPIGLVSIVLDEAQHFAASHGLGGWLDAAKGTPIEWSFCRYAVASREPFVVENARAHALVQHNPLVQLDGVRCYAGIPLISSRGFALGSFCVIGTEERSFDEPALERLRAFATQVVARIEARRVVPTAPSPVRRAPAPVVDTPAAAVAVPVERVPGYELEAPTHGSMLDVLERYVECDEAKDVWVMLCKRVGLDPHSPTVDPNDAMKLVDALEGEGGVFASCAKGLRIRIMTYLLLGQRTGMLQAAAGV